MTTVNTYSSWKLQPAGGLCGEDASITLDENGSPYVFFWRAACLDLLARDDLQGALVVSN